MKTIISMIAATVFMLTGAIASAGDDEAEVLAVLDSWNEGWASRDAALAVSDYAEDCDWTNAFGDRFQSRAELLQGLEFIFSLDFVMAGDSGGNEYQDVTFLTPEIALIRSELVREGQQYPDGRTRPDRHINHLRVVEKKDGKWRIVSHLISQAQPKGSPPPAQ